jgi:hypothetical protein
MVRDFHDPLSDIRGRLEKFLGIIPPEYVRKELHERFPAKEPEYDNPSSKGQRPVALAVAKLLAQKETR